MAAETRPDIEQVTSSWELNCWYWLKSELLKRAKGLGLSTSGSKIELTQRISASLDGKPTVAATKREPSSAAQLSGELTRNTIIPAGQRSSQALRAFFQREIGEQFHFDRAMREFIADGAGSTLGDAIAHWEATRVVNDRKSIDEQFEYNRFTRAWHEDHPGATREEVIAAWTEHRSKPKY